MAINREIGPFEILERLGAGGMGEVFKARDKRLNRFVAVKFLPESASAGARERFQREALAIAAFNHPHICTLYEIGEDRGQPFLVMELLEGETLHARLARGAVAPPLVVQFGIEISDALQAAHAKGILHRDLKPGNIFVTPRGIKVLDFGLAGFAPNASSSADEATLAGTAAAFPAAGPLTSPGATLGTAAYMSPEQARGELLDPRSDIFSLGVVLFQMASGQPPFKGRTSADLSAAILTQTPPPASSLRAEIPPKLDDIIAQCLEKEPDLRFQSAADLRAGLRRLGGVPSSSSGPASGAPVSAAPPSSVAPRSAVPPTAIATPAKSWLWPAAAVLLLAAFGAWWALRPRTAAAPPQLQFRQLTFTGHLVDATISPDGKFLAHVDLGPQGTSLHLLSISSGSDVEIMPPAPGCCFAPSFSPDGGQVYFIEGHDLLALPVLGGAVRTVAAKVCSGAGFSPDGTHIAYAGDQSQGAQLVVARADGTDARVLHQLPAGEAYLSRCWGSNAPVEHSPAWSPDGRFIAAARFPVSVSGHISLTSVATGQAQDLGPALGDSAADMSWLPDGSGLLITAQMPGAATMQEWEIAYPGGQATRLTNDVQGYVAASLSNSGQLALLHSAPQQSVWVQPRPGAEFQELPGGGTDRDGAMGLAWTPEGRLLTLRELGPTQQLWSQNSDGGDGHAIAADHLPAEARIRDVAPNGQILLNSQAEPASIWRLNADGSGLAELFQPPPGADAYASTPIHGGRDVAFMMVAADGDQTLDSVPLAGGTPTKLWNGYIYARTGVVSRDGTRAFVMTKSTASPRGAGYLRLDTSPPQFVPLNLDRNAASPFQWSPDGKAVVYKHGHGSVDDLWAQPIDGGKAYPLTHFSDLKISQYAFSADGKLAISRGSDNRDVILATGLMAKERN